MQSAQQLIIFGTTSSASGGGNPGPAATGSWQINNTTGAAQPYGGWTGSFMGDGQQGVNDTTDGAFDDSWFGVGSMSQSEQQRLGNYIGTNRFDIGVIETRNGLWTLSGFSTDGTTLQNGGSRATASSAKFLMDRYTGQMGVFAQFCGLTGAEVYLYPMSYPPYWSATAGSANPTHAALLDATKMANATDKGDLKDRFISWVAAYEAAGPKVRYVTLVNEAINNNVTIATAYNNSAEYLAFYKYAMPLVSAAMPNIQGINDDTWQGPNVGPGGAISGDATAVDLKNNFARSQSTVHWISFIALAPTSIRTDNAKFLDPNGFPVTSDEQWFVSQYNDPIDPAYVPVSKRASRIAFISAEWLVYRGGITIPLLQHAIKRHGNATVEFYAPFIMRKPGDAATYGLLDSYSQSWDYLAQGVFDVIPHNWAAYSAFFSTFPIDSTVLTVTQDAPLQSTCIVAAVKTPGNKVGFIAINDSSAVTQFTVVIESGSKTFDTYLFNATNDKTSNGQKIGASVVLILSPGDIITGMETGYDAYPVTPSPGETWGGGFTSGNVPENTSASNTVLATLTGGTTFEEVTDASNKFDISGASLRLNGALDFEAATSHSFTYRARTGRRFVLRTITINVTNINEAPTDIALSSATIQDDASIGTTIGTLSTVDPDAGDTFVYTFLSNPSSLFSITGALLKVAASLSGLAGTHDIDVQTQDQGGTGLTFHKVITITVTSASATSSAAILSLAG